MKIAVTCEEGNVFQHFGHTAHFQIYDVENGKVISKTLIDTSGSGHGALAGLLKGLGVETLIGGGIGGGARLALANANIRLYGGVTGSADEAVAALLDGSLAFDPDVTCSHHGDHHGESCGDHGCGEHRCGE